MFDDEPRPPKTPPFETLSIDELFARIERLKSEIARCEEAIAAKQRQMHAAANIFGGKSS